MVSSRKLSNEEVEALIEGLSNSSGAADGVFMDGDNSGVRPFTFGSDDLSLLGDYYALRMINERFSRFARSVFCRCCGCNRESRRSRQRSKPLTIIVRHPKTSSA